MLVVTPVLVRLVTNSLAALKMEVVGVPLSVKAFGCPTRIVHIEEMYAYLLAPLLLFIRQLVGRIVGPAHHIAIRLDDLSSVADLIVCIIEA